MIPVRRAVYYPRLGTGKLRHLKPKHFWVQEAVARGEVEISVDLTGEQPSDVLTHQSSNAEFKRCLEQLVLELRPDILNNTCPRGGVEI